MFFLCHLEIHPPLPDRLGTYLDCLGSEMSKALGRFGAQSSFPKPSNLTEDAHNSVLLWGEIRGQQGGEEEERLK